jgi:DNA-binding response OmpR family regulator
VPKVLIASEDPRARTWVRMALGPGWGVAEASTGVEARRIVQKEAPDLVIADETMERYGAFGLARDLKTVATPPAIVVLLERAQDDWLARWSGADRWLVRPIDPFELAGVARELTGAAAQPAKEGTE